MLIGLLLEVSEDLLLMKLFVAIFKLLLLPFVGGALGMGVLVHIHSGLHSLDFELHIISSDTAFVIDEFRDCSASLCGAAKVLLDFPH